MGFAKADKSVAVNELDNDPHDVEEAEVQPHPNQELVESVGPAGKEAVTDEHVIAAAGEAYLQCFAIATRK